QSIEPNDMTAEALERAERLYGFRMTEHRVDSDAREPRVCMVFSDPLLEAGVDYADFVRMDGPALPVEASGHELCISGLKHGQTYRLTLRTALPSATGEVLRRPVDLEFYVRDRTPSVRFTGRAYVLPKSPDAAIPVVTVNTDEVELRIHRIGDRNLMPAIRDRLVGRSLDRYAENRLADRMGEPVWQGTGRVQRRLNEDVTTALPIGDAVREFKPGIYVLTARVPDQTKDWQQAATQWFVVTDLGLATLKGNDGLHVFARSLSDTSARAGVTLRLIATSNELLAEAVTDDDGHALFPPGLLRGKGGMAPALVTAETEGGEDFVYLDLTDAAFDLSDRGVAGRESPPPVDLFVTTDRGVYRPGETLNATILARDAQARAVEGLTLTAILTRPDGVEHARIVLPDQGAGGHVLSEALPGSAMRGTWRLALHADPNAVPLASASFLVEDFVPERIDFDLDLPEGVIATDAPPPMALAARFLYGAPGAGLMVEGEVRITATRELPGFPRMLFGRFDESVPMRAESLPVVATDDEGKASLPLILPELPAVSRPLMLTAVVRLREGSGRPVERKVTRPLAPTRTLLGIRPLFEDVAPESAPARFEIAAVGTDLKPVDLPHVGWTLNRVERRWQWYQVDGQWHYEPITRRSRIASGEVSLEAGKLARIEAPVEWGRYELKLVSLDDGAIAASHEFWAGWYAPETGTDTPDRLEVGLDRPAYRPGDTAKLRVSAREAGLLLVQVLSDRLIDMQTRRIEAGETVIDVPVTEDWGPGAYVSATLIRPLDAPAKRNPERAIGIAWAGVDPGAARLDARFEMPDEVAPRRPVDVSLKVAGLAPGTRAWATIAAIDLGILNVTGFKSPDPAGYYFGQRKLGVEMRDLYGRLIDGLQGDRGLLRSGGDGELDRSSATPPTDELVAFFSGPIEIDAEGMAHARFDLPDFNGTLRLMAVVWSADAVGQAERDVLVRDPVVITTATPRFLAPGDRTVLGIELAHVKGPAGAMKVTIDADPALSIPAGLSGEVVLETGARAMLAIPLSATAIGDPEIRIGLVTPDGKRLTKAVTVPVRVNDPEIARQSRIPLAANGGRLLLDDQAFDGIVPGTGRATFAIGPLARFDAPGLLAALDRYPYGCTEQITSRAMPLLYLADVARAMGLSGHDRTQERIAQSIRAVLANQSASGAFGLWYPDTGDFWLDAYVTDFLSRARALGHDVPDTAFRLALINLRNQISYAGEFEKGGEAIAYALMVLARENAASIGDLRYYADIKGRDFATPLAKAQLGLALAYYGDQRRADAMFRLASLDLTKTEADDTVWRVDYGSRSRDAAAVLTLASEARSEAVDRGALLRLAAPVTLRPSLRSTQENAWALLAAHALIEEAREGDVLLDGVPMRGPLTRIVEQAPGMRMVIENAGAEQLDAVLTVFGVPDQPEPAGGDGYKIERAYYTLDGKPVDMTAIPRNTRLVAVLTVTPERDSSARLIVNDPLPAGLEIENPHLLRSGDLADLAWIDLKNVAKFSQFRDQRFLAAV
ncbi:MAG: alpha-2-macroglobulin family protein, partial [Alphaproteobacteria bacterium]